MKMKFVVLLSLAICFSANMLMGCGEGDNKTEDPSEPNKSLKESIPNPPINNNPLVDYSKWEIKDGKFYLDGEWVFLKIARPLGDYSTPEHVETIVSYLDILRSKHYNTVMVSIYWSHFDMNGDGIPDKSFDPVRRLIDAIYAKGMYPCLSVESYPVGGAKVPDPFWDAYPDAFAINEQGQTITDTEYGFDTKVSSIYHEGFKATVRKFIKELAKAVDTKKVLYFESAVEPQYMGHIKICYSEHARNAYNEWRKQNNISDATSEMPKTFPIPDSFVYNETWNKFRAQYLAQWINGDLAAYREIAGENAYTAVDYLDADESVQILRMGIPEEMLKHLTAPNIIQINWSWYFPENKPNQKAYDRVCKANKDYNKNWAISEHMTFNGSDFTNYYEATLDLILENTLNQGTRFSWEFVNTYNNSYDNFTVYNSDWTPKRAMKNVDNYWGYWLHRVKQIEEQKASSLQ